MLEGESTAGVRRKIKAIMTELLLTNRIGVILVEMVKTKMVEVIFCGDVESVGRKRSYVVNKSF